VSGEIKEGYNDVVWLIIRVYSSTQNNPVGINKEKTKAYEELIRKGGETPEG
jgi:hypothetical protein